MSHLDTDTSRRVVFSKVFLKSVGYSVLQIKNRHRRQTISIVHIIFLPASNQLTGQMQGGQWKFNQQ